MARAIFRFYAELGDFLPPERRGRDFAAEFHDRTSVKDAVEALGVPHTEVDLILVDGEPAGFDARLRDGARVSVYPVFEALDVGGVTRVRARPLRAPRFVVDVHLGKLAKWLRLLGFDVAWGPDFDDARLAEISAAEHRVLLTRDRGLLKRSQVTHGCCVRASEPGAQALEIVRRLDLAGLAAPFTRCLRCNGVLLEVAKAEVADRLPPRVRESRERFRRCGACGRLYWEGTHQARLRPRVEDLLARAADPRLPNGDDPG